MNCPNNQELTNYIFSNKENKEIESHLLYCDKCMDTVILSQKTPKINNLNYKAVFALAVASLLVFLIPYNIDLVPKNELNIEVVYFEEYLENEADEFEFMWKITVNSIRDEDKINYINFFSDDDLDVFEI